jgi:glutamate-1-semialdehyde 2,1-aminomutase
MAERLKLKPDLVTYGKVLGGGFPVGAYAGQSKLMSMVAPEGPVYQAGTLSANPVGMQVGLATLNKLESQNAFATLEARTRSFTSRLNTRLSEKDLPLQATSTASIFWIHGVSEKPIRRIDQIPSGHVDSFKRFFHECLKRGIYLAPSGYEVGFISLAHSDTLLAESADLMVEAAVAALSR